MIWNLPNDLTVLRILLIPVCLVLLALGCLVPAAIVFALAAITDFLDGYIARSRHLVTNFGKFADPVADKMLVLTTMIFLTGMGRLPYWAIAIVAARELMVDGLRLVAVEQGQVIAAGKLGKVKTTLQLLCILAAMLLPIGHWVTMTLYGLMAAMTIISGAQYFWNARGVFQEVQK